MKPYPLTTCPHCKGKGTVKDFAALAEKLRLEREAARKKDGSKIYRVAVAQEMGLSRSMLFDLETGRRAGFTPERVKAYRAAIRKLKSLE